MFRVLQSAAMNGEGADVLDGVISATSTALGAVVAFWNRIRGLGGRGLR